MRAAAAGATDPPAGWDCHGHVFGPYDRHPLAPLRSDTPPEAPLADYLAHLQRLGLEHGVLVHPSAYGADHGLLMEVLADQPQLRGVMVRTAERLEDGLPLGRLRARGVRALRFSHRSVAGGNFAGSASLADLLALAPALDAAGLHAELWTDCAALATIAPQLRTLPCRLVIDHMGGFDVSAGVQQAGFQQLLALLAGGRTWVKLCAYRNLPGLADPAPGRAFHDTLLRAAPERLLWGADWPHLRVQPRPDALDLLALLRRWTPDAAQQRAILVDNPRALYG